MSLLLELLTLIFVLNALFGIGKIIEKSIGLNLEGTTLSMTLGSASYSILIFLLGPFCSLEVIVTLILVLGSLFSVCAIYKIRSNHFTFLSSIFGVNLFLLAHFVLSIYPSSYFDPLNYHLYGIVEWLKIDRLVHIPSAIQLMHNSYADMLYFPLGMLLGTSSPTELVSVQITSQLLTYMLGIFPVSLLITKVLAKYWPPRWVLLMVMAVVMRASLHHKGLIAKNDWIAISWLIAGAYLLNMAERKQKKIEYLGLFLIGMSIGAKFTYFVPSVVIYFIYYRYYDSDLKKIAKLVVFSLVTASPFFIRNFLWTDNPIFPMGSKIFINDHLGPSWIEGLHFFDIGFNALTLEFYMEKIKRVFTYEPVAYFSVLIPFFFKEMNKAIVEVWKWLFSFIIIFVYAVGPNSEMRHFGVMAMAINGFGVYGLYLLVKKLKLNISTEKLVGGTFILVLIFNMMSLDNQLNPVPSAVRNGILIPRTQTLINEKKGLALALRLPQIINSKSKIALIDDTPPYYFSTYNIFRLWDDPIVDRKLDKCSSLICVLDVLVEFKVDYLISTNFMFDPYYRPGILDGLQRLIKLYPEAVVLSNNGEFLISVNKLFNLVNKNVL